MNRFTVLFIIIICIAPYSLAADSLSRESAADSAGHDSSMLYGITMPSPSLLTDKKIQEPTRYDLLTPVGLSLAFPGLGQIYCKKRVLGSLFISTELIMGLMVRFRYTAYTGELTDNVTMLEQSVHALNKTIASVNDSLQLVILKDSLHQRTQDYEFARLERRRGRYTMYHSIGWSVGLYVWNIVDVFSSSNHFANNAPKKPFLAASLSSIPFLGLGQIYNGSFSKAGLIWTTQVMLAFMAYNYHRLMQDCIDSRNVLLQSDVTKIKKEYYAFQWNNEYTNSFKRRNTYLWYFVLFYFYGIFDAAVDAHLHDYEPRIRLSPDLGMDIDKKSVSFTMNMDF